MNLEEVLQNQSVRVLISLEDRKGQLAAAIADESLLPELKPGYEEVMARLAGNIAVMAAGDELQTLYARLGTEGFLGLQQLAPIEEDLSADESKKLKTDFNERLVAAEAFFIEYGAHTPEALEFIKLSGAELAVASAVEVNPVDEAGSSESNDDRVIVDISFDDENLYIGKQKRAVPFSQHRKGADYSNQRRAVLQFLLKNQSEELSSYQLWEGAFGPDIPFDAKVFTRVIGWLTKLTHSRRRIIEGNKKTGAASRYWVAHWAKLADVNKRSEPEADHTAAEIPDYYEIVRHLRQLNFVLAQNDVPVIDGEVEKQLHPFAKDYNHIEASLEERSQARKEGIAKSVGLLESDEIFWQQLQNVKEDEVHYDFAQYLLSLDERQRSIIKLLVKAKVEEAGIESGGRRLEALDERGHIIAFFELAQTRKIVADGEEEEEPENEALLEEDDLLPQPQPAPGEAAKQKSPRSEDRWDDKEISTFETIEGMAYRLAHEFLAAFNPQKTYKREQLKAVFSKFETNFVASARGKGGLAKRRRHSDHNRFSIRDFIRISVYNDQFLQPFYNQRKYRKHADELIDNAIYEAIQETTPSEEE